MRHAHDPRVSRSVTTTSNAIDLDVQSVAIVALSGNQGMAEVAPILWAVGSSGMRDRLPAERASAYPIPAEWSDGVGSEPDMRLILPGARSS